jgi:hypothetical protein
MGFAWLVSPIQVSGQVFPPSKNSVLVSEVALQALLMFSYHFILYFSQHVS